MSTRPGRSRTNFAGNFPPWNRSSKRHTDGERGWALISVLWTVTLLALLAAGLQALSLTSWRIESRVERAAIIDASLDASVSRAAAGITDPRSDRRWRVDGVPQNFSYSGLDIRVNVQDAQGLINLNAASDTLLEALLKTADLPDNDAASLTDKIIDWRSATDLHRLHGATDADYRAQGYAYHQRHAPFQSVDELLLVMGMTPRLYAKIAPALTVDGMSATPSAAVAPRAVLLALNNNDGKLVDALLAQRLHVRMMPDDLPTKIPPGIVDPEVPFGGRIFIVTSAITHAGHTFARRADIEFGDDSGRSFFLLDWR